jgi:hypothetical protein
MSPASSFALAGKNSQGAPRATPNARAFSFGGFELRLLGFSRRDGERPRAGIGAPRAPAGPSSSADTIKAPSYTRLYNPYRLNIGLTGGI